MTTRILAQLASLALIVSAARAADVAVEPVTAPEPCTAIEVVVKVPMDEPELAVCPGPIEEPQLVVCVGLDGEPLVEGKPDVEEPQVVTCDGVDGEVVEVRTYTGSEVERGGGEVDPVIMYSTGGGIMTLGGTETLGQEVSATGIAAVASLKVDVADLVASVREVQVLDTAGDIIISD
jgi:hypothetical protein